MSKNKTLPSELPAFIIVGSVSAMVHFALVVLMVVSLSLHPLIANILAFLLSFIVSYNGHRNWTFADTTLTHTQSLPRFFLVSSGSFICNEIMYFLLLKYTPLPYWLSLAIVLVLVAILTFISGRLWAFRKDH